MKKWITLLYLTLSVSVFSQINLDSLNSIWNDKSQEDTIRIEALESIFWSDLVNSNLDSAFVLAQNLLDITQQNGNQRWEAIAYFLKVAYSTFKVTYMSL